MIRNQADGHLYPPAASTAASRSGEPTLDWKKDELWQFLGRTWSQEGASKIQVVGRVEHVEGASFAFLKDLHHPMTGHRLAAPASNTKVHEAIFITPAESQRHDGIANGDEYAIAEIELSPLLRRKQREDPLACTVREGTLTPLRKIPANWGVYRMDSPDLALIPDLARGIIEERLKRETAAVEEKLKGAVARFEEAQATQRELAEALSKQRSELALQVEQAEKHALEHQARIDAMDTEASARRNELEQQLQALESLLRERGERMVALKLIDAADLERILPSARPVDERPGHDFSSVLGGDWSALARHVQAYLWQQDTLYTRAQVQDFITLLRTNDLIVLAGDSGSGKTMLVKSVAEALGGRAVIVPVKPNWTSAEDLLGYYNPIEGRYHPTSFLQALMAAGREPEVPYFICLDEMNLARVEYYFADFLSLLETRGSEPWVQLYTAAEEGQVATDNRLFLGLAEEARKRADLGRDTSFEDLLRDDRANQELRKLAGLDSGDTILSHHARLRRSLAGLLEIPPRFRFPRNAWIIGAINVDETTHYLSPKVLDRAHVLRFRNPVLVDWAKMKPKRGPSDPDPSLPVRMKADELGVREPYPPVGSGGADIEWLKKLSRDFLDPLGVEFGLRAIRQSIHYMAKAREGGVDRASALNNVMVHKILPKMVIEVDKTTNSGATRGDLLLRLRDAMAEKLGDVKGDRVVELAVDGLDALIARAAGNHGIANFWAR